MLLVLLLGAEIDPSFIRSAFTTMSDELLLWAGPLLRENVAGSELASGR